MVIPPLAAAPKEPERGPFGQVYRQFAGGRKAKEAIRFLKKTKGGEAASALYHPDIGLIDLVWGENDPETNKGFGLKHIIEKHGKEIKELGFEVESFVPIVLMNGNISGAKEPDKVLIEGKMFRAVIMTEWRGKKKTMLLTAFDLRKKPLKK